MKIGEEPQIEWRLVMENERGPQAGSFGPGLDQYLANGGKIIISVKNGFLNYELEKDGNYSTAKTDGND